MIIIHYKYFRKVDKTWQERTKKCMWMQQALGFCLSMKKSKTSYVTSWECDDPYENEWLFQHISISEINRKED